MNMDIKPRLEAEKITGEFYRTVMTFEEDVREITGASGVTRKVVTRTMKPVREKYTEAYMIYYPQGHSIRVAADDEDQLRRLGVLEPQPLVDMNSGEVVPQSGITSLKSLVTAKTRNRGRDMVLEG